jgi:cholinesterase
MPHKPSLTTANLRQQTGQVYNFSNIRYAQPPVGNLRFAAPVAPTGRNTKVNNGSVGAICPQASPVWSLIGSEFATAYAKGVPFNFTAAVIALQSANLSFAPDPRTSEDCLFLDVFVPKHIFDNRSSTGKGNGAAVLVW